MSKKLVDEFMAKLVAKNPNEKEFNQLKLHKQKVVLTALKEFGHE